MASSSGKDLAPVVNDQDPQETREWQEALESVIARVGKDRAHFLIQQMIEMAREEGINIPYSATTAYINTIPPEEQPQYPGDADIEIRIRSCTPTATVTWAGTSPRLLRRRRFTTSASTGSGAVRTKVTAAT